MIDMVPMRASSCAWPAHVRDVYDYFADTGLQYGPGFRTLFHAWSGANDAVARLQPSSRIHGSSRVHPAYLDDALKPSSLIFKNSRNLTRLPFSVETAQLQSVSGALWAVSDN